MNFNRHSNLEGQHAFLGASKYHWINYDEDKVATAFRNHIATQRGTELHDLAARLILLRQKLPKSQKTLNMYVNDAIGYKMTPEQMLYYSENCFGTADAISFKQNVLRIHDLKTGEIPAHMRLCQGVSGKRGAGWGNQRGLSPLHQEPEKESLH